MFKEIFENLFRNERPNVLTTGETIELIAKQHLSICRYGDGEFNVMLQGGVLDFKKMI